MNTPTWIGIAGVSVAAVTALIMYYQDGSLSINGNNISSASNISSENGNVTIIQNSQKSERNIKPDNSDHITGNGVVDGRYDLDGIEGGEYLQVDNNEHFHYWGGNCTFDGKLVPSGRDLLAWVTATDGICEELQKIDKAKIAFRLSPNFGSRSNYGRFHEFYLASNQDVLDVFTNKYVWYPPNQ